MRFATVLPFFACASALPSILPRQNSTVDYGYWDALYTSEGFAAGSTETVTATYSNPSHDLSIAVSCRVTEYRGSTTRTCNPGFSFTWGPPYDSIDGITLGLKQTVELDGEQVTVSGSALLRRQTGVGSGRGSRASGRVNATIVSS